MIREFKVITLCGSTKFKAQYERVNHELTMNGNIVISCGVFGLSGDGERSKAITEIKSNLDKIHLAKIDMADEIFVINVAGYIGKSTANEIKYAFDTGKSVRYLCNPFSAYGTQKPHPMDFDTKDEFQDRLKKWQHWEDHEPKLFN